MLRLLSLYLPIAFVTVTSFAGWFSDSPTEVFQKTIKGLEGKELTTMDMRGESKLTYVFSHLEYDVKKSDSTVSPFQAVVKGEVKDAKENNYEFTAQFGYQEKKWTVLDVDAFQLVGGPLYDKADGEKNTMEAKQLGNQTSGGLMADAALAAEKTYRMTAALVTLSETGGKNMIKKCLTEYLEK